jgi:decaprenylphospho-beta-D-erythro-pentofuranosid-2-ulose 2-reductase
MSNDAVLILGARSDIARAIARKFAALGHPIQLAARNASTLEPEKTDLALRFGVSVTLHEFDVLAANGHTDFVAALPELPGIAVCAVGMMGDQAQSQIDAIAAALVMRSNFEGPAAAMAALANAFEARGSGTLVGISSVAGERGRASNYVYGAAKAGFTAYLSGLRNRLGKTNVHVLTVLPGFVATAMTEGLDLPARLTAQPDSVADAVVKAVARKRNVIYVKPIWALVMCIIRALPEVIFKKTSL